MPDGTYTATLQATGITTPGGMAMASNYAFNFFTLAGDANHDGTVNIADLGILASNYGKSGTFQVGDFNYDGLVNIADLGVLATTYGAGSTTPLALSFAQALAEVEMQTHVTLPEPAGVVAVLLCIGMCTSRRRAARVSGFYV